MYKFGDIVSFKNYVFKDGSPSTTKHRLCVVSLVDGEYIYVIPLAYNGKEKRKNKEKQEKYIHIDEVCFKGVCANLIKVNDIAKRNIEDATDTNFELREDECELLKSRLIELESLGSNNGIVGSSIRMQTKWENEKKKIISRYDELNRKKILNQLHRKKDTIEQQREAWIKEANKKAHMIQLQMLNKR